MKRAPAVPTKKEKVRRKRSSPVPIDKDKLDTLLLGVGDMRPAEVRFTVNDYYREQDARKRADMQIRHLGDATPSPLLFATADAHAALEKITQKILGEYAEQHPVGRWMLNVIGVGPVISAGMLAHLQEGDVPETVGHWWSFAGLNPERKWERGSKRPYNAGLKQLAWHFGECIKRSSNHPDSFYGPLYQEHKAKLEARDAAGGFAAKVAAFTMKDPKRQKEIREAGVAPPFYLDRMASRWIAKIFLSHLHALMYWHTTGNPPPKPFAISVLGHAHEIRVPDAEKFFPGFDKAYYGRKLSKAA